MRWTIGVLTALSLALVPGLASADVIFEEDFSDSVLNLEKWSLDLGSGTLVLANGTATLSSAGGTFPYLFTPGTVFPQSGTFTLSVRMRFVRIGFCGSGFAPTNLTDLGDPHGFSAWWDACCGLARVTVGETFPLYFTELSDNDFHDYEWHFGNSTYTFRLDGVQKWTSTSAFLPAGIFLGHPSGTTCDDWTSLEIDYVGIDAVDNPPVVVAPEEVRGWEGMNVALSFTVSAWDPDGGLIAWSVSDLPAGAGYNPGPINLTFSWFPVQGQAGTYTVTFTASNSLSTSASTRIVIDCSPCDAPPIVSSPAMVDGLEGTDLTVSVGATDPDGEAITSLAAAPLPVGAVFTPTSGNSSGELVWTPDFEQGGDYAITFTAQNALSGSATTQITVRNRDRHPTIHPISDQTVQEGQVVDAPVHATDPDGDDLKLLVSGPPFAALLPGASSPGDEMATLRLAPEFSDSGFYPGVTVTARGGLDDTDSTNVFVPEAVASFDLAVVNVNRVPALTAPASILATEQTPIAFGVTATDPDGDPVTLSAINRPVGSLFIDNGDGTAHFTWTPDYGQSGQYVVTFTARDPEGAIGTHNVSITVDNLNRPPTASPGGPYSGVINVPLTFDGTASTDPDGDALTYLWDFGDLMTGVGALPAHTYTSGGTFLVTLTVSDGSLSHAASTSATIQSVFVAEAFFEGGNRTTRLNSGKATTCVQIEPVGGSYHNPSVDLGTIVMRSPGTGTVEEIGAIADKTVIGSDRDRDGVEEITACFGKASLRELFGGLPGGRHTVTVTLEGALLTGGMFRTTADMDVVASGGGLAASLAPNPANPTSVLTFRLTRPGVVRAQVFDAGGRLVRTLVPGVQTGAGYHDVPLDGRDDSGERLRSGVYFWRLEAEEGVETGRFVVAR